MSKNRSEKASCSRCANRTNEHPPFCTWLKAEIPVGLADDPGCEGFVPKNLRTSKGKATAGPSHAARPLKGNVDVDRVEKPRRIRKAACPKTIGNLKTNTDAAMLPPRAKMPEKSLIQTVIELKGLKGSVVKERICCGKPNCHCSNGAALHGPYPYLHFWKNGKVRRRYLTKTVSALLSHPQKQLEGMLRETEAVLGQERKPEGKVASQCVFITKNEGGECA